MPGAVVDPDLPPELGSVALRALVTDPRQRFGSADEMQRALRSAARGPAPAAAGTTQRLVGETAALPPTSVLRTPPAPTPPARRRHWSRYLVPGVAAAIAAVLLLLFVVEGGQPATPSGSSASRTAAAVHPSPSVAEANAIKQVAASLAGAGLPGDRALASSMDGTAAAKPGARREAAAQQSLNLAGVLLAGGGITQEQFQDVASVLQSTGATVPTTTTTTTTTTTVPSSLLTPPGRGDHKDHGGPGGGPGAGPAGNSGDTGNSGIGLGLGG
jgi:ferric-dicitrate binding protein FerR (iron transport regulator)